MKFESTGKAQKSVSLTVYRDGFGVVKEVRELLSESAVEEVQFSDVAKRIEPDSIVVHGLQVLEQVYDYGLVDSGKLLESYIGDVVTVRNPELGDETQIRLLSTVAGIIGERVDTREILLNPSGELILPPLPEGFSIKPALVWRIMPELLNHKVHVSYLTDGLDWEAIYIMEIRGENFKLAGWINIVNETGTDFRDVRLKLIAGQVNRHSPAHLYEEAHMMLQNSLPARESFEERRFADKHVYTLEREVDLVDGQSKKISFLSAQEGSFKKVYKVEKTSKHAKVTIMIENTEKNGLGVPLPKGIAKVYELDSDGELEFTGEDAIGHTPVKEKLSLTIGEAFDIVSESRETVREKRDGIEYVTYRYGLRNGKNENVRIDISHAIYEPFWKMESSSHDYEVKNTSEVEFSVRIAAGKSAIVEFTYKVDDRTNKK
ncbi:DUF4139 domain-containing protein [Planococcus sp. 1R117A]|uniref:DUF4139 domain-containing protein n=1 Tax=Planococcus sp. 1R117A TaxID=3447020 RepID=UPI003EDB8B1E